MATYPGQGFNPLYGPDPGPPPPHSQMLAATGPPPDTGPPPPGTTHTNIGHHAQYYYPTPAFYPPYGGYYAQPAPPPPPHAVGAALALDASGRLYQYVSNLNGSGRVPQPGPPPTDPTFPAANLVNGTGGAGAEPGYNYFFPTEHAKVVVLKCAIPPWKLVPGTYADIPFHACKVPASVTMAELLVGFGADHPDRGRNQLWEVYPQGGGRWGWKEHLLGDDAEMMAKTVRDMGWVEKRADGQVPTVYLWIVRG